MERRAAVRHRTTERHQVVDSGINFVRWERGAWSGLDRALVRLLLRTIGVEPERIAGRRISSKAQADVAFVIMRLLMTTRLFWGKHAGLTVANLREAIGAPKHQLAGALSCLRNEGLVHVERRRGRIGLTPLGVERLLG